MIQISRIYKWRIIIITITIFLTFASYLKFSNLSAVHIVYNIQSNASVTLVFPQDTGSRILAHYTEHLTWLPNLGKGSRPGDRHTNAWTSDLAIGYWLSGPTEDLPDMLRRLKMVFDPIALPRKFAEEERGIVMREFDLRMANNPDAQAAEDMEAFLYEGNTLAASVIGTPGEIKSLSYDDAKAFHLATHRPERAQLVVIGDISERQLASAMHDADFPDINAKRQVMAPPAFKLAASEIRTFHYSKTIAAPRLIWRKVVTLPQDWDFDLLDIQTRLLRDILDTNLPGGIAGPLRFDSFLAKSFEIEILPIDEHTIEMSFLAEPDKDVSFSSLQEAFELALTRSAQGIPPATYARVHERFKSIWPHWDDEMAVSAWMADYVLNRVSNLREPLKITRLRNLDSQLRAKDIDSLLKAMTGPGRLAIGTIGKDQLQ